MLKRLLTLVSSVPGFFARLLAKILTLCGASSTHPPIAPVGGQALPPSGQPPLGNQWAAHMPRTDCSFGQLDLSKLYVGTIDTSRIQRYELASISCRYGMSVGVPETVVLQGYKFIDEPVAVEDSSPSVCPSPEPGGAYDSVASDGSRPPAEVA